jgi:hypothetical protein
MQVSLSHSLSDADARAAVERAFAHYQTRYAAYHPKMSWLDGERADVSFSAKGLSIHGTLVLLPGKITIEAKVPLLVRPFTSKAIHALESEMLKWIPDAKRI